MSWPRGWRDDDAPDHAVIELKSQDRFDMQTLPWIEGPPRR